MPPKRGRNLIEGDFKIGEGYLTGGHLSFPQYENPTVLYCNSVL